jgi:hypothetical protein
MSTRVIATPPHAHNRAIIWSEPKARASRGPFSLKQLGCFFSIRVFADIVPVSPPFVMSGWCGDLLWLSHSVFTPRLKGES